jgi:undecaprenyl-diphosphatase|tara:strand:- start:1163 stop:1921 length:759 start_codon:yes stop_codon:yes gene_type:complete
MIEIFVLSLIQGITEFLPISSSSHLIIFSEYLKFENQSLSIDVSLHIGSFFAVLFYFRKDILNFFINKELFLKIISSSIPVMFVGYILVKFNLIDQLRNIKIIGWTTIIFGIFLYFGDKFQNVKEIKSDFNYKSALIIGFFQILSLVPGVSRSGITITAARILNYKRVDSAKISFLLSIPTLAAVSFFGITNLIKNDNIELSIINFIAIFLSFIFSLITIKYFLKYIKNFNLNIFVIYRILLGLIILSISYL